MLLVNDQPYPLQAGLRLADVVAAVMPRADVWLVNGVQRPGETLLAEGDVVRLIRKGEIPSAMDMEEALRRRHTPAICERLGRARVGIMGLGGLGSAVAVSLAKVGVGRLLLADSDYVDLTNIHRQYYFIDQIGEKKTAALQKTLVRSNPFVMVETVDIRLTASTIVQIFQGVDVLVECFDDSVMKATALRTALTAMPKVAYVGASGVAGYGSSNTLVTRRIRPRVYVVGDDTSDVADCGTLMAPRVGIAAQHQANQVVRLLLGLDEA